MKRLTLLLTTIFFLALSVHAGSGTWNSTTTGGTIKYKTTEASSPAKDKAGKLMTVVYLENLSCEKIGQNSNAEDVAWLLGQGYRVIELDYAHNAKAVSPYINIDIIKINAEMNKGTFCECTNISTDRAYVLFEGYRLQRDVSYYLDDNKVYNYPDTYTKPDSLYMDIVYPANPSRHVPTILSFSYSNSYAGNQHKRMFLGYAWGMFSDSFMEGAPAVGAAWAIADHPKYCDWGRGNRPGGAQKEYGAIEVNPDAARKVHSAIRTVRGVGRELGLGNDVVLYGFSRGSTAASLAIGDAPFVEWKDNTRGRFPEESAEIQGAFLGPGVFDYSLMPATTNEYKHMDVYTTYAASESLFGSKADAWAQQGGATAIKAKACPCFLFYNTDDDPNYDTQMQHLMSILDNVSAEYQLLKNFGTGHAVPVKTDDLARMYRFLITYCMPSASTVCGVTTSSKPSPCYSLDGRALDSCANAAIVVTEGKKFLVRK